MRNNMSEEKSDIICEFRYGIIADLTNPYLSQMEISRLIYEKSLRQYDIPFSSKTTLTAKTISNWLKSYLKCGKNGLVPKVRRDSGKSKALSDTEQEALTQYLESHPELTAKAGLKVLQNKGIIKFKVSQSALSRFIIANGLTRKERREQKIKERNLKFEFFAPLECVQADAMHSFKVTTGNGKKKKAILLSFLDDATRRIVYSKFIDSENAIEFEAGIKHILMAHGKIITLYTDNGPQFISNQTKRILDILGIREVHTRPGRPQGRGKKERFYRTVRDQFERPLDKDSIKSFDDLNIRFKTWLESEYHRTPHRGLMGATPLDMWLKKANLITRIDPTINIDEVFYHEIKRKIYADNTFTLGGQLYEVPGILAGKKIKLLYDPHKPVRKLYVYFENKLWGEAKKLDAYSNTKIIRSVYTKDYSDLSETNKNNPALNSLSASKIGGENG